MRAQLIIAGLAAAAAGIACGGAKTPARPPGADEALARLRLLAAALEADDARRALEVGDPEDGIVFWGQPGAYPRPLFRAPPGASVQNPRGPRCARYADSAILEHPLRRGLTPMMAVTGVRPRVWASGWAGVCRLASWRPSWRCC